jgi:predicted dehydrogenase
MRNKKTRRDLLKYTAATGIGFWVSGRSTWADEVDLKSPSEKINIASIGIGGKGDGDSDQAARHGNLIAICDIDDKRLNAKAQRYPKAEKFNDFRKMFDKLGKQIDAVTVSTPDHTHAVATMMAIKMGKAVYTQKPLTHDVWEARQLRLAAKEHNVATQMGNQGTAHHRLREGVEVIQSGMLGAVKEVHVWTDRPTHWWPQSPDIVQRPAPAPVPDFVHWDEWLGTAPERPYSPKYYHPHNWRGWWDFGCGALGDMGCHTANLPFMALKLGYPSTVFGESEKLNGETYPAWARVTYEFPQRGNLPPVTMTWYEGSKDGKLVQPPAELIEKVLDEYNKVLVNRGDKRVKDGKKVTGSKSARHQRKDDGRRPEVGMARCDQRRTGTPEQLRLFRNAGRVHLARKRRHPGRGDEASLGRPEHEVSKHARCRAISAAAVSTTLVYVIRIGNRAALRFATMRSRPYT